MHDNQVVPTVLVVDDEPIVREVVVRYLVREGYATLEAGHGDRARELVEQHHPDLVVLDVMLPGTDGLELCRWIRSRSQLPVIMLTARGEEADRIVGLELGADDYVTKPFSPRELAARVRTVLRRSAPADNVRELLAFGEIELDAGAREARKAGTELRLTAKEFDLLWFLASHPRRVFSRDQLMSRVWGYAAALDTGTVTVHVRRLREKIEDDPSQPRVSPDRLGHRLPARPVILEATVIAAATLGVGLVLAVALRALPTVRLQLVGLAVLAVCLPLASVLLSGWVMFHMGDDVKILAVSAASATVAVIAGLFLAHAIVQPLERVRSAATAVARGDLQARAPECGPSELSDLAESFNELAAGLEQLFDARRELVAWASHDLRTPLANMLAVLEALEDGLAEPSDYVPALREQVRVLSLLVDDLFELARIDSGALTLELRVTPLSGVVRSCLQGIEAEARARQIELRSSVDDGVTARFAPEKVERVLLNLLTNALRHTPSDGAVAVRVEPRQDEVAVIVEDTGEGLGDEARARMFERFWRSDRARSSRGAGLGLAIARGLVEAHGGRIWAEDVPGGGARVSFTLPSA